MKTNKTARISAEFDRRFDVGEDIHDILDMSKAKITRHKRKVHLTLDVAEGLASSQT